MYLFIFLIILIILLFTLVNNFLRKTDIIDTFSNNQEGILFFCQGWTDIFNNLSLINYYLPKYSKLHVIIRNSVSDLVSFYIKDLNNVNLIIFDDTIYCDGSICKDDKIYDYIKVNFIDILNNSDILFHGWVDKYRNDQYKDKFSINMESNKNNFVNNFYLTYDISINNRIENFIFTRDIQLEDKSYNNFIKENGEKYILYHSNDDNTDFIINKTSDKYINLNKKTNIFFDYIKILENSIEIHLIDSSWGAFIYLLDSKYGLFKDKKIYLYPTRGYIEMFQDPILLDNCIFVN